MKKIIKLFLVIILSLCLFGCKNERDKSLDILEFVTSKGTKIEFEYKDFEEYSLKIPKILEIMDDETKAIKYPSTRAPQMVYTNEESSINLALQNQDDNMTNEQIPKFTRTMQKTFESMGEVKSVDFFVRDGHKIGEIKFISQAVDTKIFNHMIFFSVDKKLEIVSFNCVVDYQEEWEDVSNLIINSIKFE